MLKTTLLEINRTYCFSFIFLLKTFPDMKSRITIVFIFLCFVAYGNQSDLNSLIRDRNKFAIDYQNIKDSVISSRAWKNYLLVQTSDSIMRIDNKIISLSVDLMIKYDSLENSVSNFSKTNLALMTENDQLNRRTLNDIRMILILKIAIAVLFVGLLVAIYFIYKLRSESTNENKHLLQEIQDRNDQLKRKLEETENQLSEVSSKNKSILTKINKLISDLSNVN